MTPDTPVSSDRTYASASLLNRAKGFLKALWNADDKAMRWALGLLIIVLAGFNFVRGLDNPNKGFWDESYYLTTTQRYEEGKAQYASHPPLGFMFMDAGVKAGKFFGINKNIDTHALGDLKKLDSHKVPKGYDFTPIRMPAALFAVISALLFYLIVLKLGAEAFEAFIFSLMFVFENAFIVHFRAAHLDSYQFAFTLGSILVWLYTFGKEPKRPLLTYGLFGLLCGLSFMVKVNSLVMLALGGFSLLRALWINPNFNTLKTQIMRGLSLTAAFTLVVVAVFSLHVVFNPNPPDPATKAGQRDARAMGQTYKDYLADKRGLSPAVIWDATAGYYKYMKHDFTGEVKTEPNGSQPVLWPFMAKAISYRWDFNGKTTAYTQMLGNPVNWGLGIVGIIAAFTLVIRRRAYKIPPKASGDYDRLEALLAMYMIFWLVHIYLGLHRVMYIYHYFIGLALSYFLLALSFRLIAEQVPRVEKYRFGILCCLSIAIAGSFLFYAPLTYHQNISKAQCEWRNIPVTLVICQPVKKKAAPALPSS
ncbi:MAG: phospholipid carrier-dependent glycosyltransferase [Asticcacaulis sp.]